MSILDIIFIVAFVVAIIIGLARGFAKMITKFLCILIALIGSVVLVVFLLGIIQTIPLFASFQTLCAGWFPQEHMVATVSTAEELSTLLSGENVGVLGSLASFATQLFDGMSKASVNTLGGYFGHLIASILVAFVLWLVCYLILKYALLGIKKLIALISKVPVFSSLNRIFGVLFSSAFAYLIVIGVVYSAFVLVCAKFFPAGTGSDPSTMGDWIVTQVNSSAVFHYVHATNFIGEVLGSFLGLDYLNICAILPVA